MTLKTLAVYIFYMNEYAGILLNCLNSLCNDLGRYATKRWIKRRGEMWEVEVSTFTRSPYADKLNYEPNGIEDNLWLIQGMIHMWESDFSDLFDKDESKGIVNSLKALKKVRTNLAHSNIYPSKGQCLNALNHMLSVCNAFKLSEGAKEEITDFAKGLVLTEDQTESDDASSEDESDPIMLKINENRELRLLIDKREDEITSLKNDNFLLRKEISDQRPQSTHAYFKKEIDAKDATIAELESKLKSVKAKLRIWTHKQPKFDHPKDNLDALAEFKEKIETLSGELEAEKLVRLNAFGHARFYKEKLEASENNNESLLDKNKILTNNNRTLTEKVNQLNSKLLSVLASNKALKEKYEEPNTEDGS